MAATTTHQNKKPSKERGKTVAGKESDELLKFKPVVSGAGFVFAGDGCP